MKLKQMCAGVAALATSLGGLTLLAPGASAAELGVDAVAPVAFGGQAWGSQVKIAGPLVNSGKTALVGVGCTRRIGIDRDNSSAAINIPGLADIDAVATTAMTDKQGNTFSSTTTSTVEGATALSDEIEIGAITSTARAFKDGTGFHAEVDVDIASLFVGGVEQELTGDEQVIEFEDIAIITIAGQKIVEKDDRSSAKVLAIEIEVLDTGARLQIGYASASVDGRAVNGVFFGGAYGTTVEVAGTIESGKTAYQPMPCVGTGGENRTNEVAEVDLGEAGTAEGVVSTVNATQTPRPEAIAKNEIADATLAGGLLTLEGIVARVHVERRPNGNIVYDTNGTTIGEIKLAGITIPLPDEGETIDLPGVGTLTFLDVTEKKGGRGANVVAVRVHLDDGDTDVVLASATAGIGR